MRSIVNLFIPKLHFIVRLNVGKDAVRDYSGLEEHVRYETQRRLAGLHFSCEV